MSKVSDEVLHEYADGKTDPRYPAPEHVVAMARELLDLRAKVESQSRLIEDAQTEIAAHERRARAAAGKKENKT